MKFPFSNHKKDKHLNLDQLKMLINEERTILSPVEYQIMLNMLNVREKRAKDIMTPLSEVLAVKHETSTEIFKKLVKNTDFSYIPVYEDRIDQLIGIIDVIEVLYEPNGSKRLGDFLVSAYYIPDTKRIFELLPDLQRMQHPIAIVVNEHGGCVGIVTLENLFEQIVGEIGYQPEGANIQIEESSDGSWAIEARCRIEKLNQKLQLSLPTDICNTVGGLIMALSGKIPSKEEEIDMDYLKFTVLETCQYGISKLRLTKNSGQWSVVRKRTDS